MIVYPIWETTPSPQPQVVYTIVESEPKKKKKKKVVSTQPEQLSLFIDDYAIEKVKIPDLDNISLDKILSKLAKTISQTDISKIYDPNGKIPFPKIDLNEHLSKYKSLETFDNSLYYKAYTAADNLSNSVGVAKVKVEVTKDQIPSSLFELPEGTSLSNKEIGEIFGIPTKDLLGITIEITSDESDPFTDLDPIYTVTFERTIPKDGDIF